MALSLPFYKLNNFIFVDLISVGRYIGSINPSKRAAIRKIILHEAADAFAGLRPLATSDKSLAIAEQLRGLRSLHIIFTTVGELATGSPVDLVKDRVCSIARRFPSLSEIHLEGMPADRCYNFHAVIVSRHLPGLGSSGTYIEVDEELKAHALVYGPASQLDTAWLDTEDTPSRLPAAHLTSAALQHIRGSMSGGAENTGPMASRTVFYNAMTDLGLVIHGAYRVAVGTPASASLRPMFVSGHTRSLTRDPAAAAEALERMSLARREQAFNAWLRRSNRLDRG